MAERRFERDLRAMLAADLDAVHGPHPRWADAPVARRAAASGSPSSRWRAVAALVAATVGLVVLAIAVGSVPREAPVATAPPSVEPWPSAISSSATPTTGEIALGRVAIVTADGRPILLVRVSPAVTGQRGIGHWLTIEMRVVGRLDRAVGIDRFLVVRGGRSEAPGLGVTGPDQLAIAADASVGTEVESTVWIPYGDENLDLGYAGGGSSVTFHYPIYRVAPPAPTGSVATKAPEILRYTTAIGWLDGRLLVSDSPSPDGEGTRVWLLDPTAVGTWTERPALAPPSSTELATDGRAIAYVQGTSDGHARTIELRDAAGRRRAVELPGDVGSDRVWGNDGSVVPQSGGGFVLTWASILAIVADDGSVATHSIPSGFLVMRPTSDRDRYLLVRADDVNVPYGFSSRAPASLWLWDRTSGTNQLVVADASEATPSASGLALVRRGDGSWWRILADGTLQTVLPPGRQALTVSPGGEWYVGRSACAADTLPERCVQPFGRLDAPSTMTVNGVIWSHAWHDEVLGAVVDLPFPWQPSGIVVVDGTTARMFALP